VVLDSQHSNFPPLIRRVSELPAILDRQSLLVIPFLSRPAFGRCGPGFAARRFGPRFESLSRVVNAPFWPFHFRGSFYPARGLRSELGASFLSFPMFIPSRSASKKLNLSSFLPLFVLDLIVLMRWAKIFPCPTRQALLVPPLLLLYSEAGQVSNWPDRFFFRLIPFHDGLQVKILSVPGLSPAIAPLSFRVVFSDAFLSFVSFFVSARFG